MKEASSSSVNVSHFRNENAHSALLRYGIPIYIIGTLALLLASDIGSGISAIINTSYEGKVIDTKDVFKLSVFTSVQKLWDIGSYPVAILIAVLSIAWPYLKLLLTMGVWFMPWNPEKPRRRELAIEVLDACSKWSLIDVLVLFTIMVGLRYTARVSMPLQEGTPAVPVQIDLFINPEWGLSGFIAASLMSLASSHLVLYLHRRVVYATNEQTHVEKTDVEENNSDNEMLQDKEESLLQKTGQSSLVLLIFATLSLIIFCCGYFMEILQYEYTNPLGNDTKPYSLSKLGSTVPQATEDSSSASIRWIQAVYFLVSIVTPLLNHVIHLFLYLVPMKVDMQKKVQFTAEVVTAWNGCDVLMLGVLVALWQVPKVANRIIEVGCAVCYEINSRFKGTSALAFIGAVMYIGCCYRLNIIAHRAVYGTKK